METLPDLLTIGIPKLYMEIDQQSETDAPARRHIQVFLDSEVL